MSDNLPAPSLPLPHEQRWKRSVSAESAFAWLAAGWRDFTAYPGQSLAYGALVFLVSVAIVFGLFRFGADYILLPALSGFMVVGPLLALGLYEKSRRLEVGERPTLNSMIFVRPASGGQVLFTGALLYCHIQQALHGLLFRTHFIQSFDLALFQLQNRLDGEHGTKEPLRAANTTPSM